VVIEPAYEFKTTGQEEPCGYAENETDDHHWVAPPLSEWDPAPHQRSIASQTIAADTASPPEIAYNPLSTHAWEAAKYTRGKVISRGLRPAIMSHLVKADMLPDSALPLVETPTGIVQRRPKRITAIKTLSISAM